MSSHNEELKLATDVKLCVGMQGEYKYLSYVIGDRHISNGDKDSGLEELEIIKSYGIPYKEVKLTKKKFSNMFYLGTS